MEDENELEIEALDNSLLSSQFLGNYILPSSEVVDVVKLNTVQLQLPKQKTPQKNHKVKKSSPIKTVKFIMQDDMIELPINQVLKTVLELMNEIPVEEEVSWKNIRLIRQNYLNLKNQ
jgi:hypothetical protein